MDKQELKNRWRGLSQDFREDGPKSKPSSDETAQDTVPKSRFFGVDLHSPYVPGILITCRTGEAIILPWAIMSAPRYFPDEQRLRLRTMENEVNITGTGLFKLFKWLHRQKVEWIKESATGIDDQSENLFIMDIEIRDRQEGEGAAPDISPERLGG